MSIAELMKVEPSLRREEWLCKALQWAIELEFSTIPTYLCGMWSIIDGNHPVSGYLQSIVLQEMAHMGLACNSLTTLGGTPNISGRIPKYPPGERSELFGSLPFHRSSVYARPGGPASCAVDENRCCPR
jgi:hypothetical protein